MTEVPRPGKGQRTSPHAADEEPAGPAHLDQADAPLDEVLRSGEGQRIEFKSRLPGRDDRVAHLLAALANAGGGTIAVGVDDRGQPVGIGDPESVRNRVADIAHDLLEPPPELTFRSATSHAAVAGPVVLIHVAAASVRVEDAFSDNKTAYVRVNDRNLPLPSKGRGAIPAAADLSLDARLSSLDAQVRERFERSKRRSKVFGALDYARRNNVSMRTARRDIRQLKDGFLVVETAPGVYEAVEG